ncbi:MAG: hypothetical protein GC159_22395 [Phycisphaera sp.]|nr:hypothetical protein [Phycisphaera sp.]
MTIAEWMDQSPRVRAYASVFPNATLIGGIEVGVRAFVGANAAVSSNVPAWHTAAGVPARSHWRSDVDQYCRTSHLQAAIASRSDSDADAEIG